MALAYHKAVLHKMVTPIQLRIPNCPSKADYPDRPKTEQFSGEWMVVKTEIIHMKERDRYSFYLCSDKSDLKGFQRNFQTFFSQLSVPIWHLSITEHVRKKAHLYFWKIIKTVLVWQKNSSSGTVMTIFSSKPFKNPNNGKYYSLPAMISVRRIRL